MDTLSDLHNKLQEVKKRQKRRSPLSPAVPPELAFPPLEMDWSYLKNESKVYEKAIQDEIER